MKKHLLKIIIICFCILFAFSSCTAGSNNKTNDTVESKRITLTKENFEDYFVIEIPNDEMTISSCGGEKAPSWSGFNYWPTYHDGIFDSDINVFAKVPLYSYNVVLTLKFNADDTEEKYDYDKHEFYEYSSWTSETVTLNISSEGSGKGSFVIETKESSIFSSSNFEDDKLIYSIDSVTGSIELK